MGWECIKEYPAVISDCFHLWVAHQPESLGASSTSQLFSLQETIFLIIPTFCWEGLVLRYMQIVTNVFLSRISSVD